MTMPGDVDCNRAAKLATCPVTMNSRALLVAATASPEAMPTLEPASLSRGHGRVVPPVSVWHQAIH